MKRTIISISAALLTALLSFAPAAAQERKSEQKIKIVIADGSGEKVVIDTIMNDKMASDTLKLKDGKVIFIGHSGDEAMMQHAAGPGHVFVTVTDDGKDNKKVVKEITVISADSAHLEMSKSDGAGKVYVITSSNSAGNKSGGNEKTMTWTSNEGSGGEGKVVIIKDGKILESTDGNTISYHISSDKMQSDTEKTKYVISKDGMKITVEGSDYDKVKALVNEIEAKLGSDKDKNSKKK
jgi:hypothetical protein